MINQNKTKITISPKLKQFLNGLDNYDIINQREENNKRLKVGGADSLLWRRRKRLKSNKHTHTLQVASIQTNTQNTWKFYLNTKNTRIASIFSLLSYSFRSSKQVFFFFYEKPWNLPDYFYFTQQWFAFCLHFWLTL